MKKYEQLKKIIQEANPEIMEREIKIQNVLEPYFVVLDGRDNDSANETIIELSEKLNHIRLADVLLAINNTTGKRNYDAWLIGGNGYFYELNVELKDTKIHWNLEDDNLDNQSDETKKFLIKLLVKE